MLFPDSLSRVEIVEGDSDFCILTGRPLEEGRSPGNKARAGMAGVTSGCKGRVESC